MKALVTGGAGFIGSNLVHALVERGAEVTVIDDLSRGRRDNLEPLIEDGKIQFDVCRIQDVEAGGWDTYDAVFHLAALARIQPSIDDPVSYALANDVGTLAALEIARKSQCPLVYSSSSSVYGLQDRFPVREDAEGNPQNPYALTKAMGELWCELYARMHGVRTVALRYFNVFGERMASGPYATVIGIFDDQVAKGEPLTIVDDGNQMRAYTYVGDVVAANLLAAATPGMRGPYNVCGPCEVSVNEIAEAVAGPGYPRVQIERRGEVRRTLGDTTALEAFGWRSTVPVLEWIRARASV
jgi:UDP-glucose 4-epimerase